MYLDDYENLEALENSEYARLSRLEREREKEYEEKKKRLEQEKGSVFAGTPPLIMLLFVLMLILPFLIGECNSDPSVAPGFHGR